jgi:hypothetical protein
MWAAPQEIEAHRVKVETLFAEAFPEGAGLTCSFDRGTFNLTLPQSRALTYRLGLVDEVRCLSRAFPARAVAIFRREPVSRVVLPDLTPVRDGEVYLWTCAEEGRAGQERVPPDVFRYLRRPEFHRIEPCVREAGRVGFSSLQPALTALARAGAARGRVAAGFPARMSELARRRQSRGRRADGSDRRGTG